MVGAEIRNITFQRNSLQSDRSTFCVILGLWVFANTLNFCLLFQVSD